MNKYLVKIAKKKDSTDVDALQKAVDVGTGAGFAGAGLTYLGVTHKVTKDGREGYDALMKAHASKQIADDLRDRIPDPQVKSHFPKGSPEAKNLDEYFKHVDEHHAQRNLYLKKLKSLDRWTKASKPAVALGGLATGVGLGTLTYKMNKKASLSKEAGNPVAIANALSKRALGKPLGELKDANLRFGQDALKNALGELTKKYNQKGHIGQFHAFQRSTAGIDKSLGLAGGEVPTVAQAQKKLDRHRVLNDINYLKNTQPRPMASPERAF